MGVGIAIGGTTVGRPPSVANAGGGVWKRIGAQQGFQIDQFAGLLADLKFAIGDHRDTRGVIAAVLHAPQSGHDYLKGLLLAYITHDSAHALSLPLSSVRTYSLSPHIFNGEPAVSALGQFLDGQFVGNDPSQLLGHPLGSHLALRLHHHANNWLGAGGAQQDAATAIHGAFE